MKSFSWKHLLTSLGAWRPSQPAALRRGILLLESECLRARHKGAWLTSDDTPHPPEEPRPSLPARVSPIICERLGARDSRSGLHPPSAVHTALFVDRRPLQAFRGACHPCCRCPGLSLSESQGPQKAQPVLGRWPALGRRPHLHPGCDLGPHAAVPGCWASHKVSRHSQAPFSPFRPGDRNPVPRMGRERA